jgi:uncharacterized protein (TIGR00730 family)
MVTITIFCGSKQTINEGLKRGIEDFIKELGGEFKYAYGGGSEGIMGIVNKTCIDNGYYTIGVNCHRWKDDGDSKLNEVYYFESIVDRQNILVSIGDCYVVLPGGVGTVYEALQCITMNDVKEASKPVFFLNTNNYFMHLFDMLEWGRKAGTISKTNEQMNIIVKDRPDELAKEIKRVMGIF